MVIAVSPTTVTATVGTQTGTTATAKRPPESGGMEVLVSKTVDCGEGKHDLCVGTGHTAYLFPQESRAANQPPFNCGCRCHHDGRGVPCAEC